MRSLSEVNGFVGGALAVHVGDTLRNLGQLPGADKFFSRDGWFREGTVQAYLAAAIVQYVGQGPGATNWIVLQEHPYKELPDQRADLWVVKPAQNGPVNPAQNESVLIEVKADFDLESAEDDYFKVAIANPRHFDYGYVFFCATAADVDPWKSSIEKGIDKRYDPDESHVYARGIRSD